METKRISAEEARDNFDDLLGSVRYGGQPVIVEKKGRPLAVVIRMTRRAVANGNLSPGGERCTRRLPQEASCRRITDEATGRPPRPILSRTCTEYGRKSTGRRRDFSAVSGYNTW